MKKLKETKETKKRMGIIRAVYDLFKNEEILFGEMYAESFITNIHYSLREKQKQMTLKDVGLRINKPTEDSKESIKQYELSQKAWEIMEDMNVAEALEYLDALQNAINMHKYKALEGKTIEDLKIKFLSDEEDKEKNS